MTSRRVLDVSAAVGLLLGEPESLQFDGVLESAVEGRMELLVPSLFWFEAGNALLVAERRRRIESGAAARLLSELCRLPLKTDPAPSPAVLQHTLQLAASHGLSAYDAAYVELARRFHAPLLTLDAGLARLKA